MQVSQKYIDGWRGTRPYGLIVQYRHSADASRYACAHARAMIVCERLRNLHTQIDEHAVRYIDIVHDLYELKEKFEQHAEADIDFSMAAEQTVSEQLRWEYDGLLETYFALLERADYAAYSAGVFDELIEQLRQGSEIADDERMMLIVRAEEATERLSTALAELCEGHAEQASLVLSDGIQQLAQP